MNWQAAIALGAAMVCISPANGYAAERTVQLSVPDMNCPACPFTVKKGLQAVPGVEVESVDLDSKTAVVVVKDDKVTENDLTNATTRVGFPSTVISGGNQ